MAEKYGVEQRLDPVTKDAAERFGIALQEKLFKAQKDYNYRHEWQEDDLDGLRRGFLEHLAKGDPLDVAAYALFFWARGEKLWP